MGVALFGMFTASTVYFFYKLERWSARLAAALPDAHAMHGLQFVSMVPSRARWSRLAPLDDSRAATDGRLFL